MADEHEFNAPADQLEEAKAAEEAFAAVVGPAALAGTWNACDAATRVGQGRCRRVRVCDHRARVRRLHTDSV